MNRRDLIGRLGKLSFATVMPLSFFHKPKASYTTIHVPDNCKDYKYTYLFLKSNGDWLLTSLKGPIFYYEYKDSNEYNN